MSIFKICVEGETLISIGDFSVRNMMILFETDLFQGSI